MKKDREKGEGREKKKKGEKKISGKRNAPVITGR